MGCSTCSSACWIKRSVTVGMPSSRSPPSGLGIVTRRTGLGRYVPDNSCSRIAGHAVVVDIDLEKFFDTASYCPLVHEV